MHMSPVEMVGYALIGAHIVCCTLVTRRVAASSFYEPIQKRIQLAIVWLIPMLGVILVWLFLCHERPREPAKEETEDDDVQESIFADHDTSTTPTMPDAASCDGGD